MEYLLTFLEGFASFISPCLLPMLPIYISYFMGDEQENRKKAVFNSIGFVSGFTLVFLLLSVFASTLGGFIGKYISSIKIIFGIIIIFIGLNYMELLKINFLNKSKGLNIKFKKINFIKALIFGMLFSISWTPCIGAFLSSALLLIANEQEILKGIILMLLYSIGLGVPFVVSAILIEKFQKLFDVIKQNYKKVKILSGIILIVMGIYIIFF